MFILGLTGSIGMGKSTTAKMFAEAGCAVWDADAAVHRLYAKNGLAVQPIKDAFPKAIVDDAVSRTVLKQIISDDSTALQCIEQIVHPLVARDRAEFLRSTTDDIAVLDIPLLYENGSETSVDAVACVLVCDEIQRERVLARGTMTEAQFETILAKQMPAEEKAARADYVIRTETLEVARERVHDILSQIRKMLSHA